MAAILAVAEPGISVGSRVELTEEPTPLEMPENSSLEKPGYSLAGGRVVWNSWTRTETYDEGMERFVTIARAIARVGASPPPEWRWGGKGGVLQIERAEVTIARHESGFWKSVHEGKLRGSAGEVCLVQIHPVTAAKLGIDLESLVGLDIDSTERCFRAGVIVLAKSRALAERRCAEAGHWFAPTIAAYGSGKGCVPEGDWIAGVEKRVATYAKTATRKALPANVVELLYPPT